MLRSLVRGAVLAVASAVVLATPVLAHGDHDARPLARHLAAGPYTISLWQVYPDAGSSMTPHLIVMFDDRRRSRRGPGRRRGERDAAGRRGHR